MNITDRVRKLILVILLGFGLTACSQQQIPVAESRPKEGHSLSPGQGSMDLPAGEGSATMQDSAAGHQQVPRAVPGAAHQDHESKHGDAFFMALDEKHHIEGVLMSPGTFKVFLFEEHSLPLSKQEVARAAAKVIWGEHETAPEVAMKPSADGRALEAASPAKVAFPLQLTLLIRLPGAPADSRPELFTFPFKKFTHDHTTHKH
ncbi:MAG: hypothetical protein EXQ56_06755 [Acidobacteria bacterium]|nr:hypothetical protein [Acidobacteriota bacterium]